MQKREREYLDDDSLVPAKITRKSLVRIMQVFFNISRDIS
jgi:hypothetical protein